MPVQPPWTLDIETIGGVAITLLAMLVVQVGSRLCKRRRHMAVQSSPWRPSGPGDSPTTSPMLSDLLIARDRAEPDAEPRSPVGDGDQRKRTVTNWRSSTTICR